ncbi:ECF RNA polymerase sigma factor SigE [bioreactor metagenome]|uniref:ECF RNA polymerase sigma factor SigE n=1 Tax=bioreactor metagenome TaxID=1076179 RepID=A0A645I767_9ZZZZ
MDKEESLEINNALNSLPDMYRIPIVLYHKQGMAYQEIADAMGEPLSKVKNRIFRGRKMLKDYILASREGVKK